jgi:hypothetical protein
MHFVRYVSLSSFNVTTECTHFTFESVIITRPLRSNYTELQTYGQINSQPLIGQLFVTCKHDKPRFTRT